MILTYRFRIKDKRAAKRLNALAFATNQVWNFCCETDRRAYDRWLAGSARVKIPTAFDLISLTGGSSKMLGVHADTIGEVCRTFFSSRRKRRRTPRFRTSAGAKRSLGWVPFRGRTIKVDGDTVLYLGMHFRFWRSREVVGPVKTGSFSQDARGRWYLNLQAEVQDKPSEGVGEIGIDVGLKSVAVLSTGESITNLRHYRRHEVALGKAQRARNKPRVRAICAKIANSRRHHLHEASTRLVRANKFIAVGNVSASAMAKTRMAKSVLDVGWATFREMLRYKAMRQGVTYVEVNEAWTTQTCSDCGSIGGPKGTAGLEMRAWECMDCGASHDRDVNAARNILRLGLECQPPVAEIAAQAVRH